MNAVSKLVATVLIVGVSLSLAIIVALMMAGIVGTQTRYEELEIISSYAVAATNKYGSTVYRIVLDIRNTGSVNTTIDKIFVNGKPVESYGPLVNVTGVRLPLFLPTGNETTIYVDLDLDAFKPGQMIDVRVHTSTGMVYPTMVTLP